MLDPTRAYYQRQIEAATGVAIRAIQRELERLTWVGLLYRRVAAGDADRLRGLVATEESVRLAFLLEGERSALVVVDGGFDYGLPAPDAFTVRVMTVEEFTQALLESPNEVAPYMEGGVDLLGRREDVIWRRIEAAGYAVQKGRGVA
jgi:hypothetical protein